MSLGIKLHGLVLEVTGRSVLVAVGQSMYETSDVGESSAY